MISTPLCVWPICKRCDNNQGGACAYDHQAEAKEMGISVKKIVSAESCKLFDPIEEDL